MCRKITVLGVLILLQLYCQIFSKRAPDCPQSLVQITDIENTVVHGDLTIFQGVQGTQFYTARAAPLREVIPITYMGPYGPQQQWVDVSHLEGYGIEKDWESTKGFAIEACNENVQNFLLQYNITMLDNSLQCVIKDRNSCVI